MNKIFLSISLIFIVFVIGMTSAEVTTPEVDFVFKQKQVFDIKQPCLNNGTWCSASAVCNITIVKPNGNLLVANALMTNQGSYHNKTIGLQEDLGYYKSTMTCVDGTLKGAYDFYFQITPGGEYNLLGFFVIMLILVYGLTILGIAKQDIIITLLGVFGLYIFGLYIFQNGIEVYKNWATNAIAIITLGFAAYVSIRAGLEYIDT